MIVGATPAPDAPLEELAGEIVAPAPVRRRLLRFAFAIALAASALIAAVTMLGGFGGAWDAAEDLDARWLVAAVACETVAYAFLALHVRWVVRDRPHSSRAAPVRTALVLFGLGSVLPAAPLEGFALAGAALRRRRLDRRRMALLFGFTQWFSVRGLLALAALDVIAALALSHVPVAYEAPAALGAAFTLLFLALTSWLSTRRWCAEAVASMLLRVRHWRNCPDIEIRRAAGAAWHADAMRVAGRGRDRRVLLGTTVLAWTAEGLCLYCALRATGAHVGVDVLLLAYTVGIITSMVPLLPAGVGVVETVTPLILHVYGVPLATALAAVLTFRLIANVLPAIAGTIALAGLRVGAPPVDASDVDELTGSAV
jgi:putative heme transporter